MFWSATKLDENEVGLEITFNVNENKTDFFEYTMSIDLKTWCDANLEDLILKLDRIRKSIENFISEYQLDSKGKIIRNTSRKLSFMGPMLSHLNYEFDNEELKAFFEYHIETVEEK
jgi:hypothetical protein